MLAKVPASTYQDFVATCAQLADTGLRHLAHKEQAVLSSIADAVHRVGAPAASMGRLALPPRCRSPPAPAPVFPSRVAKRPSDGHATPMAKRGSGYACASPGPAPRPERDGTPGRVALGVQKLEARQQQYQEQVFRGNTPLKSTKEASRLATPTRDTPGRLNQLRSVFEAEKENADRMRPLELEKEIVERAESVRAPAPVPPPNLGVPPPTAPSLGMPLQPQPAHQPQIAMEESPKEFPVHHVQAVQQDSKLVPKHTSSAPCLKLQHSGSADRLMRGIAPVVERPASLRQPAPRPDDKKKKAASALVKPKLGKALSSSPRAAPSPRRTRKDLGPLPALSAMDNYEITDKEDSDDEVVEVDRGKKFQPMWARGWKARVLAQLEVDPDSIFDRTPRCDLDAIFGDPVSVRARRGRSKRVRGSSQDWVADKLRPEEVETYKRVMGQIRLAA